MMERHAHARALLGTGQIVEFLGLIDSPAVAEQPRQDRVWRDRSNRRAVLGGDMIQPGAGDGAAGARHVPDHDRWIAGNMARKVLGDRARIEAETTTRIS